MSNAMGRGKAYSKMTGPLAKDASIARQSRNFITRETNTRARDRMVQQLQPEYNAASCNRHKETASNKLQEKDASKAFAPYNRGPVSLGLVPRPAHRSRAPPTGHIQGHRSLLFNLSDGRSTKVSCHWNETATPRGLKTPPLSSREGRTRPAQPAKVSGPATGQGTSRPEEWKSPMQNSSGPWQRGGWPGGSAGGGARDGVFIRLFLNLHVCHHWYKREIERRGAKQRGGSSGGRERRAPAREQSGPSPQAAASKHTVEGAARTPKTGGRGPQLSVSNIRDRTVKHSAPLMLERRHRDARVVHARRRQDAQDDKGTDGGRRVVDAVGDDDTSI